MVSVFESERIQKGKSPWSGKKSTLLIFLWFFGSYRWLFQLNSLDYPGFIILECDFMRRLRHFYGKSEYLDFIKCPVLDGRVH